MLTPSILAVVVARSGSKGVPDKNSRPFNGRSLVAWSIHEALQVPAIDRLMVSTDCRQIAAIAQDAGADVPFLRPAALADDNAHLQQVLLHVLTELRQQEDVHYDYILLLQPTSPLRTAQHIGQALDYYFSQRQSPTDTLISVKTVSPKMGWVMQADATGHVTFCLPQAQHGVQRQQLPTLYLPNGAIYFSPTAGLVEYFFYAPHTLYYVMTEHDSIDIDTPEEFAEAEVRHKQHQARRRV